MKRYLSLIRAEQYTKNLFVFAPLFFSSSFLNFNSLEKTIMSFICFCMASSAVYIFNDYFDIKEDQLHPIKSMRPLACGTISKGNAILLLLILLTLSLSIAISYNVAVFLILLFYIILNIFYTLILKHIALLDINCIAIGFVLRIVVGGYAANVTPSVWIIIETYLLALFLALAKRRTDIIFQNAGHKVRKNIKGYNLMFTDITLGILASIIIICYIFYCISPAIEQQYHSNLIFVSILFVFNGLIRYLQLAIVNQTTYSPTQIILKDKFIQISILCWVTLLGYLLYFKH